MTALPLPETTHELELYTAEELAALWKMDKSTVYNLIRRGELPAKKSGKNVRVTPEAAREYIANLPPVVVDG